ncbi:hypothetical protein MZA95_02660 [Haemophilus influenzae]
MARLPYVDQVVNKSGDTMTGQLNANSGVNTLARGADGFNHQWQNLTAPYLVDNGNANGNNAYYPFIKGLIAMAIHGERRFLLVMKHLTELISLVEDASI